MGPSLGACDTSRRRARARLQRGSRTSRLARLAALWVVLKMFIEEEQLLSGGKDELAFAVNACEKTIHEVHADALHAQEGTGPGGTQIV